MQKIRRSKQIEGITVPVFIRNCSSNFFVDLEIYEDGMINCWELVDLAGLREKLASKWLVPALQEKEEFSIDELGSYLIGAGTWQFDEFSFYEHVKECLQEINPRLENIYTISAEEKMLWKQRQVCYAPVPVHFRVKQERFYETATGRSMNIFYRLQGQVYLAKLVVYDSEHIILQRLPEEERYTLSEIEELFSKKVLFSKFTKSEWVLIHQLGKVQIRGTTYSCTAAEKLKQVQNDCLELGGGESAFEKCRAMYQHYLEEPSLELRQKLKQYYEAIPEHQRCYLGDMDSKDADYRRIIYHPENKRWV